MPNVYLCNTCKFTQVRETNDKKRQKHGNFKTQRSPTGPTPRVAGVSSWHQEQKQKRDHFKTPAIIVVTLYLLLVCVGVVMYSGEYMMFVSVHPPWPGKLFSLPGVDAHS